MRAPDLLQKARKVINPPYTRKGLLAIGATLFILLVIPLTVIAVYQARELASRAAPAFPTTRDPLKWPFVSDSIWNLPIGANAVYIDAQYHIPTSRMIRASKDITVMTPNAPITDVEFSKDGWTKGLVDGRCDPEPPPEDEVLFSAPIPTDFVVAGSQGESTPNSSTSFLLPDGENFQQTQPFARCEAGGPATSKHAGSGWIDNIKTGYGWRGAHGGSAMSNLGGTIRIGELVPGGKIRHAMQLNPDVVNVFLGSSASDRFRWPAWKADSRSENYLGTNPVVKMGSLLVLKPDFDVSSLQTEPARIIAQAFINYGAYIVDTTGQSAFNIIVEQGPDGNVWDEFEDVWPYGAFKQGPGASQWADDIEVIIPNLHVVDNWDEAKWQQVSASNGSQGVGGGTPIQPWAPGFGPPSDDTEDPIVSITSPNNDSTVSGAVSITANASDNVGVTKVEFFVDGTVKSTDTSSPYSYSWDTTQVADGTHTLVAKAYDAANNVGTSSDVVVTAANGGAQTLTFTPSDDASIHEGSPNSVFGSNNTLEVDASSAKDFLMKFTVSGVGVNQVTSAKLRLHNTDSSDVGGTFYPVSNNNWGEGSLTWNNAPASEITAIGSLGSVSPGNWYEVDVGPFVNGDSTYSFRVKSSSSNGADYSSKEGSYAPQLVVTVTDTGGKPGDVNGDGVVNIFDASILASRWGTNDPDADLNGNGVVDIFDASIMASNWDG